MNILVVDHACHKKTKSVDFFIDLLRAEHSVDVHYYEKPYSCKIPKEKIGKSDIVIFWEFLPSRFRLALAQKPCVFVPMYDNEWASRWQWKRLAWTGVGIISFCDNVTTHARRCGVENILDVRYFPNPQNFPREAGTPKRIFLWERGEIKKSTVERIFPPHEGYVYDIKGANDFLDKKEYLERLATCEIIIAPRRKEGIGMAFLEAMAMGKCVVAHNDATMNEYINDGENGILFDSNHPAPIPEKSIRNVLRRVTQSASQKHEKWESDKKKIVPFLLSQKPVNPSAGNKIKFMFAFLLFLAEGILYRLHAYVPRRKKNS